MKSNENRYKIRIRSAVTGFIVIVLFAVLLETQITWMLSRNGAEKSTGLLLDQIETVLDNNAEDEEDRTEELKETYISYAQAVAYILDAQPSAADDIDELKKIADLQNLDEIHIFDETGTIISGTVPEYYGYSFDSGEQMGYFKPMLEDRTLSMCQDITPNTAEGKSMMYAITWNEEGTFMVQVGIEPKRLLAALNRNDIANVIGSIPLTEGFDLYVVDAEAKEIVAGTGSEAVSSSVISKYAAKLGGSGAETGRGIVRHRGKSYYCNYRLMNGYVVAAIYSMDSSRTSLVVPIVIIAVYLSIAGLGIFFLMIRLYRSEKKLKETVQGLEEEEAIIRAAGHGVWRCPIDAAGHVTGMIGNEEWRHIFGVGDRELSPEECLRYFVDGLVNKEQDPSRFDYSDLDQNFILRMTFAWNHPEKGIVYIEIAGTSHIAADGSRQVSGYAADVTEQTVAKQQWEKELTDAREKAVAANRAKTSFLFNMSHDIRTPMNAITGFTDLIEKHYDDREKCMDYLHKTREASRFLLSLINNVLEMARIESGNVFLSEECLDTDQFVDSLFSIFGEQMRQKNITFTRTAELKHHRIICDPVKLREIFLNIVSNACKYTPEGGSVSMDVRELPSDLEGHVTYQTTIADTGIGMTAEFLPHIFEEFSRAKSATDSRIEGTGLGMPIVKKYVDLMGGTIRVESEPGKGSTFIVTIDHRIAEESDAEETDDANSGERNFSGRRILLAEDNDLNAEIAEEILTDAGFEVERASDGAVCVEMLRNAAPGHFDVILMDIQMPNMNGYDATRKIRSMQDEEKASIPIIAMTANAFESDRQDARDAGMNGHVAKPIEIPKLMEALADNLKG